MTAPRIEPVTPQPDPAPDPELCVICRASDRAPGRKLCASCAYDPWQDDLPANAGSL
jgi:hypothetical protein